MRQSVRYALGSLGTQQSCEERSMRAQENLEKGGGAGMGLEI